MSDAVSIANSFGIPVAILFVLGLFLWRVLIWFKPWAEKVLQGHLTLVAALTECQRRQEAAIEKMAETHSKMAETQSKQTNLIVELKDASVTSNQILAAFQCNARQD